MDFIKLTNHHQNETLAVVVIELLAKQLISKDMEVLVTSCVIP